MSAQTALDLCGQRLPGIDQAVAQNGGSASALANLPVTQRDADCRHGLRSPMRK